MTDEGKVAWLWEQVRGCAFPSQESQAKPVLSLLMSLARRDSMMLGLVISIDDDTRAEMIAACKDSLFEWYRFHDDDWIQREIWEALREVGIDLGVEPPASIARERRETARVEAGLAALRTPTAALIETLPELAPVLQRLGEGRADVLPEHWRCRPKVITPWFAPVFGVVDRSNNVDDISGILLDPELLAARPRATRPRQGVVRQLRLRESSGDGG